MSPFLWRKNGSIITKLLSEWILCFDSDFNSNFNPYSKVQMQNKDEQKGKRRKKKKPNELKKERREEKRRKKEKENKKRQNFLVNLREINLRI